MAKNTRILTIQDVSCVGQCSLTVALPIISATGIETAILPSAVLSTHTAGNFSGFTFRDLTEDIPKIKEHWVSKNIDFDAIYTGYIGNKNQIAYIIDLINATLKKEGLLIVDPAMADNGNLYYGFDKSFVDCMVKLCAKADVILPNLTEATFLLNEEYITKYDKNYVEGIVRRLAKLGAKNVVITGVTFNDSQMGVAVYNGQLDKTEYYMHEKIPYSFHGTGDIYSSAFTGALMNGFTMYDSAKIAADYTCLCMKKTLDVKDEHWYGVLFEKALPYLIEKINK